MRAQRGVLRAIARLDVIFAGGLRVFADFFLLRGDVDQQQGFRLLGQSLRGKTRVRGQPAQR